MSIPHACSQDATNKSRSPSHRTFTSPTLELCPEHWRKRPQGAKKKLKSVLSAILLKETSPIHRYTPRRPNMRIKDSDDYLTNRAANPMTGQISPSISNQSTPDTPGAALAHGRYMLREPSSPTKRIANVEALANGGRKVKNGVTPGWLASGGMFRNTDSSSLVAPGSIKMKPAMHRVNQPTHNMVSQGLKSGMHKMHPVASLHEDSFVVKMPSAREPQPYTFPGCTSDQIQAFEHYKHKTKRTSGDGYDRRLLVDEQQTSEGRENIQRPTMPHHSSYQQEGVSTAIPPLNIVKRRAIQHSEAGAARVAFQQPLVSSPTDSFEQQAAWIGEAAQARRNFSSGDMSMPAPVEATQARQDSHSGEIPAGIAHLNQLPRVRLVHPSLASTPSPHCVEEPRKCSLGCSRNVSNNMCSDSRKTSAQSHKGSVFQEYNKELCLLQRPQPEATFEVVELIVMAGAILWKSVLQFLSSHLSTLGSIFPRNLTTWEKFMIVRSLFTLLVKVTALMIVVASIWKFLVIVVETLKLVFWPLDILLQTARWMAIIR